MKRIKFLLTVFRLMLVFTLLALAFPPLPATALPQASAIVINEIDYDQPDTDTAEFIELKNVSSDAVNLDLYSIQLINGSGATTYLTIELPDTNLAAGDYYVVCANAATVANCDQDVTPDTNLIQNGPPDAVALYLETALVDTVSYEGDTVGYTEGSGTSLEDNPGVANKSIARCPDGVDTDQNNVDFSYRDITPGQGNACATGPVFGACGDPATFIHDIQGAGASSPIAGEARVIEGVVAGDFQDTTTGLGGFFLQEEDSEADANPQTSEGLFVYDNGFGVDVVPGDVVRALGTVSESFGQTQLTALTNVKVCNSGISITPTPITLPVSSLDVWEQHEGMLLTFPQTLYVTENYNLGRYGELYLSPNSRLYNPTNVAAPGDPAKAVAELNDRSRIQLDDASNIENPAPLPPYLGPDNTLRLGATTMNLTGVLGYSFGSYEIQPVMPVEFTQANERPADLPTIPDSIRVISFNLLNYFTTIDTGADICGPSGDMDCRGADSVEEFTRQRDKIITALLEIDPAIAGLIEIENNASASIQDLVNGLNDAAPAGVSYAYINTGIIGTDAIKQAFIYQPALVSPVGNFAILDSTVDPTFLDTKNRPALAQTFETIEGNRFTVVVNHLKSKSSACDDVGDPDIGDEQGECNQTRTDAAIALANWLETDPTGSQDPDFLIMGDLNAYAMEDPITALESAGYIDLIDYHNEEIPYSYVFDGESGYLDHALANPSMAAWVLEALVFHINADEPRALDYNDYNQDALYQPDPYRSSDHDPIVVYIKEKAEFLRFIPLIFSGANE